MSGMVVLLASAFAGVSACLGAWALARAQKPRLLDDTFGGLRKVHVIPIPRIGGAAIGAGVLGGTTIAIVTQSHAILWIILVACGALGLAWGLIEDLSKRGDVLVRLALPGVAAALGFILLDARLTKIDIPGIDSLLAIDAVSFAFTVFAVTGVAHATNVIDGLNGLAAFTTLLASIGLALVAWIVGDPFIFSAACVLAASIGGFLLVNYPSGRIFLGDGGAYLIGLLLALLSVMLVHRNSEVSAWFPVMLFAYPIWETLFSMYRRKIRGHSTGRADALHLHSLVYRRVVRWRGHSATAADYVTRNSLASLCLWVLPVLCLSLGLIFWSNSSALQVAGVSFNAFYVVLYFSLVRFHVPAWLVIRAKGRVEPVAKPGEAGVRTALR